MQLVNFTLIFMPLSFVYSFPILGVTKTKSHLNTLNEKRGSRRDVLGAGFGFALISSALNSPADAFTHETYFLSDHVVPTSQLAPSDLLDVNSAFVGEYKQLRGMFPHAAGKIASHGPYKSVKDIYKIQGLTTNDVALFKQYEEQFTCLPPTRTFNERINARVST